MAEPAAKSTSSIASVASGVISFLDAVDPVFWAHHRGIGQLVSLFSATVKNLEKAKNVLSGSGVATPTTTALVKVDGVVPVYDMDPSVLKAVGSMTVGEAAAQSNFPVTGFEDAVREAVRTLSSATSNQTVVAELESVGGDLGKFIRVMAKLQQSTTTSDDVKEQLKRAEATLETKLQTLSDQQASLYQNLTQANEAATKNYQGLSFLFSATTTQVEKLQRAVEESNNQIAGIINSESMKRRDFDSTINVIKDGLEGLKADLGSLELSVEFENRLTATSFETQEKDIREAKAKLSAMITDFDNRLSTVTYNATATDASLKTVKDAVTDIKIKLDTVASQKDLATTKEEIEAAAINARATIADTVTTNADAIKQNAQRLDDISSALNATDVNVSTLKATAETLDTKFKDVESNVTDIKNNIITKLQDTLHATTQQASNLTSTLADMVARITNLSHQVQSLKETQQTYATQSAAYRQKNDQRYAQLSQRAIFASASQTLYLAGTLHTYWDMLCDESVDIKMVIGRVWPIIAGMYGVAGPAVNAALSFAFGSTEAFTAGGLLAATAAATGVAVRAFACRYFKKGAPTLQTLRDQVDAIMGKLDMKIPNDANDELVTALKQTRENLVTDGKVPAAMMAVSLCKHLMYNPNANCEPHSLLYASKGWTDPSWAKQAFWSLMPKAVGGETTVNQRFSDVFIALCALQSDMAVYINGSTLKFTPESFLYIAVGSSVGTTIGRPTTGSKCILFPADGLGRLEASSGLCTAVAANASSAITGPVVRVYTAAVKALRKLLAASKLSKEGEEAVKKALDAGRSADPTRRPIPRASVPATAPVRAAAPARPAASATRPATVLPAPGSVYMQRYTSTEPIRLDARVYQLLRERIPGRSFTYDEVLRNRSRLGPLMHGLPPVRGRGDAINLVVEVDRTLQGGDGYPLVVFYDGSSAVPMVLLHRDV